MDDDHLVDLNIEDTDGEKVKLDPDYVMSMQEKTLDINQKNFEMARNLADYVKQVGELIVDEDVLYTLRKLKALGTEMKKQHATDVENKGSNVQRNITGDDNFNPLEVVQIIKQERTPSSGQCSNVFHSPLQKLFTGMK